VFLEQIEYSALVEVFAGNAGVDDGVDTEQRLVDMKGPADRLQCASGSKNEHCIGLRLDVFTQLRGDVLLRGALVGLGEQ
jgi:hypothetical protein